MQYKGTTKKTKEIAEELGVDYVIEGSILLMGDKDKAFFWLEAAFKQHHPYIQWLRRNCSLKSLSEDPRFDDLAQRLNLVE